MPKIKFHESKTFEDNLVYKVKLSQKGPKSYLLKDSKKIKIYSEPQFKKQKIFFCACTKHTYISHIGESTTGGWNQSVLFGTPTRDNFFVSIGINLLQPFYKKMTLERSTIDKSFESIVFKILVKNTISDFQFTKELNINGSTTGKDLRTLIADKCNFIEIHSLKYSLNLNVQNKFIVLRDDVSLLMLYEHATNCHHDFTCSIRCLDASVIPNETLEIYIKQNENFVLNEFDEYSLIENWKNGEMPDWLMRLMSDLYFNCTESIGIFRENGTLSAIRKWMLYINTKNEFVINDTLIVKGSVLKSFIRNIKDKLLTRKFVLRNFYSFFGEFLQPVHFEIEKHKVKFLSNLKNIPQPNLVLLKSLLMIFSVLIDKSSCSSIKYNLAVLFNQNIFPPEAFRSTNESLKATEIIISLIDDLLTSSDKREILENFEKHRNNSHLIDNSVLYDSVYNDSNENFNCNDKESCKSHEISLNNEDSYLSNDLFFSDDEFCSYSEMMHSNEKSGSCPEFIHNNEKSCIPTDLSLKNEETCNSHEKLHSNEKSDSSIEKMHSDEESYCSVDISFKNEKSSNSPKLMLANEKLCTPTLKSEKSFNTNEFTNNINDQKTVSDLVKAINAENESSKNSVVDETSSPSPKRIRKSLAEIIPNDYGFRKKNVSILIQKFENQSKKK